MTSKVTWVAVADEAIVRILQWSGKEKVLREVKTLTDPAAHAMESEHRRGAFGRRTGGVPGKAGSGMAQRAGSATVSAGDSDKHLQAAVFARHVAEWLERALAEHRFDELHLAAAPRFLGLLRKAMSPELSSWIASEVDKDLVHASDAELATRFFAVKA